MFFLFCLFFDNSFAFSLLYDENTTKGRKEGSELLLTKLSKVIQVKFQLKSKLEDGML